MALTQCKECYQDVSTNAKTCPHCGNNLKNKGIGCTGTFIIGMILVIIVFSVFSPDSDSDTNDSSYTISHPDKFLAYNYAEDAVKKKLKAPSSADFPGASERASHVNYLGGGEYQIISWVDSENSFGANIRTDFSITIYFTETEVRYSNLKF
ncbi:hypothetical protein QO206_13115 [Leeuwenhoekiella aequorea]|uniref:hypothetical protein n=1 Tax=Leeuwenhoekiella aequorea TaxID=283736 RepID=UPI00352E6E1B|tara:strand:- start:82 stop:537 length:456 start_codon:yes stop_codon:yes gene_type:complete